MTDETAGLKIRRRADRPEEGAAEAAAAPTAGEARGTQPLAAVASPASPDASPAPAAPSAAPAPAAAAEPAPAVAEPAAPSRPVRADAAPDRAHIWRDPVAAPGTQRAERAAAAAAAEVAAAAPAAAPVDVYTKPEAFPSTDDFAAMFAGGNVRIRNFEVGDKVTANVVAFGNDVVFVSLGGKTEGAIASSELLGPDGKLAVGIGDPVEAYVVETRGGVRLSRALGRGGETRAALEEAARQGIPVEGKVTGVNKGGFDVHVLGARGFCPLSQIEVGPSAEPETYIGQTLQFLVTQVENDGRSAVVSRAALLKRERHERASATIEALQPGAVFDGVVSRVADFGAFVDIGGIDGLVHVGELSWSRVEHPSEVVSVGDRVRVSVLSVRDLDDPKNRRIGLSIRALGEDPWMRALSELQPGATVNGRVARLENFGAFVEIAPGVDGLVHVSEIDPARRIKHPADALKVGDEVQVQVVKVDPQKRQIGLSIKSLMADPWTEAVRSFPPGTVVQGTVDAVQSFGVFVALPNGLSGLLPMSHLPEDEAKSAYTRFRPGVPIEARVLAVEPERRRIALTRRADDETDARTAFAAYKGQQATPKALGTFGDLFARARK